MRPRFIFLVTILTASVVTTRGSTAGQDSFDIVTAGCSREERALLEEYRANFEKIKEFYCNLSMDIQGDVFSGRKNEADSQPSDEKEEIPEYRDICSYYVRSDGYIRIDIARHSFINSENSDEESIAILDPDNGYMIRRSPSGKYHLEGYSKASDNLRQRNDALIFHNSPYMVSYQTIPERLFENPSLHIKSVRLEKPVSGDETVVVTQKSPNSPISAEWTFFAKQRLGLEKLRERVHAHSKR